MSPLPFENNGAARLPLGAHCSLVLRVCCALHTGFGPAWDGRGGQRALNNPLVLRRIIHHEASATSSDVRTGDGDDERRRDGGRAQCLWATTQPRG